MSSAGRQRLARRKLSPVMKRVRGHVMHFSWRISGGNKYCLETWKSWICPVPGCQSRISVTVHLSWEQIDKKSIEWKSEVLPRREKSQAIPWGFGAWNMERLKSQSWKVVRNALGRPDKERHSIETEQPGEKLTNGDLVVLTLPASEAPQHSLLRNVPIL